MEDGTEARFPNLSKLSVALLEHLVEPVLGKDAITVIKKPVAAREVQTLLGAVLSRTEKRFLAQTPDHDLRQALLDLPLTNIPSLQAALQAYYERPTSPDLQRLLREQLAQACPALPPAQLEAATEAYVRLLREELVAAAPSAELREKLRTLTMLELQADTAQTNRLLAEIVELLKKPSQAASTEGHPMPPSTSPESPAGSTHAGEYAQLERQLKMAQTTLDELEFQAAGIPPLERPPTFSVNLKHQQDLVAELKRKLDAYRQSSNKNA